MKTVLNYLLVLMCFNGFAQESLTTLTLEEYLGYVKKYHPVVKQTQLLVSEGEAKLLKSRGAFDPKIEVDFDRKKFSETTYYNKLNTTFKLPTWYGVELKANFENNDGTYLNPELQTPDDGLYSAGVSVSLAKGLFMNEHMATLKQAKLFTQQAQANQQLLVNDVIYNALVTYYNWLKNYQSLKTYEGYTQNAKTRLDIIKKSYLAGDKPAIDTLEASINLKNRMVDLEKAKIGYIKSKLELSNYLWIDNNIPLELEEAIIPDLNTISIIDKVLNSSLLNSDAIDITNHPKLKALQVKKDILTIDKKLKTNNLLPTVNLQYNFLTTDYDNLNSLNTANYKSGLQINFPLFLRKERGDLKLAQIKLQDINFELATTEVTLKNKINSNLQEIESYNNQHIILLDLVEDYKALIQGEERKFEIGEGSLFLVNYREVKLIENELKRIDAEYQLLSSKSNLSRTINTLF